MATSICLSLSLSPEDGHLNDDLNPASYNQIHK